MSFSQLPLAFDTVAKVREGLCLKKEDGALFVGKVHIPNVRALARAYSLTLNPNDDVSKNRSIRRRRSFGVRGRMAGAGDG